MTDEEIKRMKLTQYLKTHHACPEAVEWVGERTLQTAWAECQRADWMLWLLAHTGFDRKRIVWLACQCARFGLVAIPEGEERPRIAIETTERWTRDEATIEEVQKAADAASVYVTYGTNDPLAAGGAPVYVTYGTNDPLAITAIDAIILATNVAAKVITNGADVAAYATGDRDRALAAMADMIREHVHINEIDTLKEIK